MNFCYSKTLKKLTILTVSVGFMGGLAACSTTNTMKVTEGAPVTYKVGAGSSSFASLRMPDAAPSPMTSLPSIRPQASPLATPQPMPVRPAQPTVRPKLVDLSNIDRELYGHMKVGKSYKVAGQTYHPRHNPDYDKTGVASWYGDKFHGKPTANGESYDKFAMTAAHKTLPLNSYVYVTNLETGKSIKVRLNDRGPFIDGRIIDLSQAAAGQLGITGKGLGRVRVQYAGPANAGDKGKAFAQKEAAQVAERSEPIAQVPIVPAPITPVRPQPVMPKVAERPQPSSPGYQPLRDLGSEAPSYVAAPNQNHFSVPNIMGGNADGFGIMLPETESADAYRMPPIPESAEDTPEEGVTTLTIKGPIHMARSNGSLEDHPDFIPAYYDGEE